MDLRNLANLELIEKELLEIREILNPEDSPYICDAIIHNIQDEDLNWLISEMLLKMGYEKDIITKINKIVEKMQA